MAVEFKTGKLPTNKVEKIKYLYRLQEKLRLRHNMEAAKYKAGQITLAEFRVFQNTWYEPRSMLISDAICKNKSELQNDTTVTCNIADIEEV